LSSLLDLCPCRISWPEFPFWVPTSRNTVRLPLEEAFSFDGISTRVLYTTALQDSRKVRRSYLPTRVALPKGAPNVLLSASPASFSTPPAHVRPTGTVNLSSAIPQLQLDDAALCHCGAALILSIPTSEFWSRFWQIRPLSATSWLPTQSALPRIGGWPAHCELG